MTVPGAHEYVLLLAESRGTCFCDGDEGWTEVQGVRIGALVSARTRAISDQED